MLGEREGGLDIIIHTTLLWKKTRRRCLHMGADTQCVHQISRNECSYFGLWSDLLTKAILDRILVFTHAHSHTEYSTQNYSLSLRDATAKTMDGFDGCVCVGARRWRVQYRDTNTINVNVLSARESKHFLHLHLLFI